MRAVREYGEERRWRRVVDAIIKARTGVLLRTMSAAELVCVMPWVGGVFASVFILQRKTFQGIRIAINGELEALAVTLPKSFRAPEGGRSTCGYFISFAGGSNRKEIYEKNGGSTSRSKFDSRPQQERTVYAELNGSKAIFPTKEEVEANPKSRSARLRFLTS